MPDEKDKALAELVETLTRFRNEVQAFILDAAPIIEAMRTYQRRRLAIDLLIFGILAFLAAAFVFSLAIRGGS